MTPEHIRWLRSKIYTARHELEKKLNMLDEDMRKLQSECPHSNRKNGSCSDCDKEFLEVETEGS